MRRALNDTQIIILVLVTKRTNQNYDSRNSTIRSLQPVCHYPSLAKESPKNVLALLPFLCTLVHVVHSKKSSIIHVMTTKKKVYTHRKLLN